MSPAQSRWSRRAAFGLRTLAALVALAFAMAGCGDDAAPPVGAGYPFAQPSDFDRTGCRPGGGFDASAAGTWHFYATFPDRASSLALRVDGSPDAYTGLLFERETEVTATGDDLFARLTWRDEPTEYLRVLDLCAIDADGTATGHYAVCSGALCDVATVTARKVVPLDEPELQGMRLLGSIGDNPADPWLPSGLSNVTVNVRVADGIAYLARYQDGLRIVDVHDPAAPVELGHLPVEYPGQDEIYNDVKVVSGEGGARWALMASSEVGVVVVDVADPTAPAIVGHFGTPPSGTGISVSVHTLFVDGGKAYLANTSLGGLEVFDLAGLPTATPLGSFVLPNLDTEGGFLHDLYVEGDRAYLAYWNRGMFIVDVSDPAKIRSIGKFADYGERTSHSVWVTTIGDRRIAVHGDEQYGAHVHIVDVTEGSVDFLDDVAEYETRPEVSVHNVLASGSVAYVTYYQDGLRVLDLSDPAHPVKIAHFHSWSGARPGDGLQFYEGAIGIDLDTATGTIYVADIARGLFVLALDP
jgi:hypothetical protein